MQDPSNDSRAPQPTDVGSLRKLQLRVRALERENIRLKRVVASQALTIEALREISRGTY